MTGAAIGREAQQPSPGRVQPQSALKLCPALLWVRATGRRVDLREAAWLRGPMGAADPVGVEYLERLAQSEDRVLRVNAPGTGLTERFEELRSDRFDPAQVDPRIREFYEQTVQYRLDLWSSWCRCFQPLGWLMTALFSRRLQQLNLPISPLEPSRGITSDIIQLCDRETGAIDATGWVRTFNGTDRVIYVGLYSTARPPLAPGPCVRVVFPLPGGNATVLLRPEVKEDGSLVLHSRGERFGDAGFYLLARCDNDTVRARYIAVMKESIHVYVDNRNDLRTDHIFRLAGVWFLKLHYAILRCAG